MATLRKILDKNKAKGGEEERRGNSNQPNVVDYQQSQPQPQMQAGKLLEIDSAPYLDLANNNPHGYQFTSQYFAASHQVYQKSKFPYGVFYAPYTEPLEPIQTRTDKIPRCLACRAYMNLYNRFTNNGCNFICALCNKDNSLPVEYQSPMVNNDRADRYERGELHQSIYSTNPPDIYFNQPPPDSSLVFLIDVSSSSYHSQMLFYCVNAIRQVLSNQQFNDHLIFFYTYDEHVHDYSLSGKSPQRKVIDNQIQQGNVNALNRQLSTCRQNLFQVLDSLEEFSKSNDKQRSNFTKAFQYVFESTKNYNPKIFICQSNETLLSEEVAAEKENKAKQDPNVRKSKLQSPNSFFYNKYIQNLIAKGISVSFFCFAKQFRNLKAFSDSFKLSNSELFYYQKDSKEEALKFYYDFYNLLSGHYLQQFKTEFLVSSGWSISATYCNMYRQQKTLICKLNNLSNQKQIGLTFIMNSNVMNLPYFIFQVISNYSINRSRRIVVTTLIKPTTNSLPDIFSSLDYNCLTAMNFRIQLSNLRMEESLAVRNNLIRKTAHFYMTAKSIYKQNIPHEIISVIQGTLAFIKSHHAHIQNYTSTALLDRIICERSLLQCCGGDELATYFVPYLFSVSKMGPTDCEIVDQVFNYPPTVPLMFNSVTSGLFIMDCTVQIYLFIAKFHDTQQIHELFGVNKLSKDHVLSEQDIQNQNTPIARKVVQLLNEIRLRKSYGYIPLYIIKCGEGSAREMSFYLNFCNENYQEFKNYQMSLHEFTEMLQTQVATNIYN